MKLTTHHVVPKLRITGTVTPLSHVPSWHADEQLQVLIVLISLIFSYFISWSFPEMTVKYSCKDIAIPLPISALLPPSLRQTMGQAIHTTSCVSTHQTNTKATVTRDCICSHINTLLSQDIVTSHKLYCITQP